MHVHAEHLGMMRTTVEISDEVRGKLMEMAARRGERGFSGLVEEALRRYLDEEEERRRLARDARSVIGTMTEEEALDLEGSVRSLRERWR